MPEYHVSPSGCDRGTGSSAQPFKTISCAAHIAQPGDVVTVHAGIYRESVSPDRGGLNESARIIYRGAPGEAKPQIRGSEQICTWSPDVQHPGVWSVHLDADFFGDFNPFSMTIHGDWLVSPDRNEKPKHLGQVFLNEVSLYEGTSLDEVYFPQGKETEKDYATQLPVPVEDKQGRAYVWFAQVNAGKGDTTIWANFQQHNPNKELAEISVRETCFFPEKHHCDYITVTGFEMSEATGNWAPPTSRQVGMVGPNWAYGWVIDNNILHDATFSALSLGKEESHGDADASRSGYKTSHQYQVEGIFEELRKGWKKGIIGSHRITNNDIYNCGQNAIVGNLGSAFCQIRHNHIHHIGNKREFFGWEVAGIKLHAAIDTLIEGNNIHDCSLGLWLDWQMQGTRITRNVFWRNVRDMMIEVGHGPYLVDDNVFLSDITLQDWAEGGAFINNLISGSLLVQPVLDRSTPYHFPHSTDIAGFCITASGDDRFAGNIFTSPDGADASLKNKKRIIQSGQASMPGSRAASCYGLASYSSYPSSLTDYQGRQESLQPIYSWNNFYAGSLSSPHPSERGNAAVSSPLVFSLTEEEGALWCEFSAPDELVDKYCESVTTRSLGITRLTEQRYERPHGEDYLLDCQECIDREDGETSPSIPSALPGKAEAAAERSIRQCGPFRHMCRGNNRVRVW